MFYAIMGAIATLAIVYFVLRAHFRNQRLQTAFLKEIAKLQGLSQERIERIIQYE